MFNHAPQNSYNSPQTMPNIGFKPRDIKNYSWTAFTGDLSGGFIASLIAFPYGLAMAVAMGLPPVLGVYTSILTAPITAFLGRNAVLIGGASSVTVPFIVVAVQSQGIGGAAKVSLVAAVLMLVISTLRLGRYIMMIPTPVMAGFSCGIGGMMVISQLHAILGIASIKTAAVGEQLFDAIVRVGSANWTTVAIAATVAVAATVSMRVNKKLPAPLIGIVAAFALSKLTGWHSKEVGWLPAALPPFAGFSWSPSDVYNVLPAGFGLAIVTSVNLLVTSRVVEHFRGQHKAMRKTDADQELGAYGIANLVSSIFGAPMSVGIPARSLANVQCGGTTRLSNIAHAGFLLLFVVEGANIIAHIPVAALAAVTAWMGARLMEWSTWGRLPKMRLTDSSAFLLTAFSAIFLNAVFAVMIGCACYGAHFIWVTYLTRPITEDVADVRIA